MITSKEGSLLDFYVEFVSQVSIVGLVKKVETSSTKISYIIDDMTGCIEAHTYTGTDVSAVVGNDGVDSNVDML